MKTMDLKTYKDKIMGCWAGKNIGGVLGAPFECVRATPQVEFYTQDLSMGPPPNDDLDLQIVWLAAAERYGRNVNASILGDYWLSYVVPNWAEYGTGKANLRAGFQPPLSGLIENTYKDSCGCFIRSEIWACLAPGHPEIAARYAYEDAIVDHEGEGVYGEIFFAAMESAAFVENDKRKLIEIGLSYIPEESMMAKCIRKAVECYDQQVPFLEARKKIHNTAPGTFGIQYFKLSEVMTEENRDLEVGVPGFDAPENVAFAIAGWMYGEDDFGKSICLANSCGEDTDCSCATLGALMGIILGESGIPAEWKDPLDDKIATMCIDRTSNGLWHKSGVWVPDTVTQLSDRVMRVMPSFLGLEYCDILGENGMTITCLEGDALFCDKTDKYLPRICGTGKNEELPVHDLCTLSPYVVRYSFPAFRVMIDYGDSVHFRYGETKKVKVIVQNSYTMCQQQWAKITAYMPAGVEMLGGSSLELPLNNVWGYRAEAEFEFSTDNYQGSKLEFVIDVSLVGRHSSGAMKVTLTREK